MLSEPSPQTQNRIVIITQFFPPDYAATGQLIEELVNQFSSQGVEVTIFTGQPGYAFDVKAAPRIETKQTAFIYRTRVSRIWSRRIRGKTLNSLLFCLRSLLYLVGSPHYRNSTLMFTSAPPYLLFLGLLLKRFYNFRYCCLIYDVYPDIAVALQVLKADHLIVKLWKRLNRLVWQQASTIITLSPNMKTKMLESFTDPSERSEIEAKIHVIHSWADASLLKPIPKADSWFAQEHGLVHAFTVLYSGNMGRCHDMQTIMEAIAQLQDYPIQFVFIGDGAQRSYCVQQTEQLKLNNCKFLPYQAKEVLPYSLTACDLALVSVMDTMTDLVAPSKLYGHLATGRPLAIICQPHSYLATMVNQGHFGQVIKNGSAQDLAQFILKLYQNPELKKHLGQNAYQYFISRFTPEIISQDYLKVLA